MRYILSSQKDIERRISAADSTTITFRLLRFENETLNLTRLKKKGTAFYFHLCDFQNVTILGGTKNKYGSEMDVYITESNIEDLNIKATLNSLHVNNCVVDGLFFDQCEIGALNIQSCKAKTMTIQKTVLRNFVFEQATDNTFHAVPEFHTDSVVIKNTILDEVRGLDELGKIGALTTRSIHLVSTKSGSVSKRLEWVEEDLANRIINIVGNGHPEIRSGIKSFQDKMRTCPSSPPENHRATQNPWVSLSPKFHLHGCVYSTTSHSCASLRQWFVPSEPLPDVCGGILTRILEANGIMNSGNQLPSLGNEILVREFNGAVALMDVSGGKESDVWVVVNRLGCFSLGDWGIHRFCRARPKEFSHHAGLTLSRDLKKEDNHRMAAMELLSADR